MIPMMITIRIEPEIAITLSDGIVASSGDIVMDGDAVDVVEGE